MGVTYSGGVVALNPSDIAIRKGEVSVLLGRSGAGKSTLLRTMNLLVEPTSGTIKTKVLGLLNSPSAIRKHRRKTGMVFQQHQLIGRQSSLTNVLTGRLSRYNTLRSFFPLRREDRELALSCLDRVGLLEKALTRVDQLSGGQQQRVGVARALAMQPSLVLADEPVASLDPETSRELLTLLRNICLKDGITLVISLHQVDFAREFADRIIALSAGTIVFDDSPEKLDERTLRKIYQAGKSSEPSAGTSIEEPTPEPAAAKNAG